MKKRFALMAFAGTLVAGSLGLAAPADFFGTWTNTNRNSRNIVRVQITPDRMIHLFGSCTPTPCDMGKVPMTTYGRSVSDANHRAATADYTFNFKKTRVLVKLLAGNRLYLETYNEFTDSSGRQNYWAGETFRR